MGGQTAGDAPTAEQLLARRARFAGCLLGGAILAAPFLALLYDPAAGLAVMAVALGATALLAAGAARRPEVERERRRRLRLAARVNAVLVAACVLALVARLVA